jgi:hypothetical protein
MSGSSPKNKEVPVIEVTLILGSVSMGSHLNKRKA